MAVVMLMLAGDEEDGVVAVAERWSTASKYCIILAALDVLMSRSILILWSLSLFLLLWLLVVVDAFVVAPKLNPPIDAAEDLTCSAGLESASVVLAGLDGDTASLDLTTASLNFFSKLSAISSVLTNHTWKSCNN